LHTGSATLHPDTVAAGHEISQCNSAVLDSRVQIKFRTARDLRLRLRVAAATTERTQDEILAEALAEGSRSPTWRGVPQAGP